MFDQLDTTEADFDVVIGEEEETVRYWRFEEFVRLGFDHITAFLLMQGEADLSLARRLIRSGCPLETALAILH